MMIDHELEMSVKQALVASTTSVNAVEIPRFAPGHNLDIGLVVTVHSQSGTNPTLAATLETSSDGSSFTPVMTVVKPAGKNRFGASLEGQYLSRYVRVNYTLGGSSPLFNVSAALVSGIDDWRPLADSPRQA